MLLRIAFAKKTLKLTALTLAAALFVSPMASVAQEGKGPSFLRDAESEQLLREYTRPILRAAGLEKQNIQMVIINDSQFNAFVADGRRIFVNYGAIMQSETPNQLIGVLAHETGHLAGGHLAKMREQIATRADPDGHRHAARRRGPCSRRARRQQQWRPHQRRGRCHSPGRSELIKPLAARSYARQQEENADKCRREVPDCDRPIRPGACTRRSSASPTKACSPRTAPTPTCSRIRCRSIACAALEEIARSSPYWDKKDDSALQLRHDMARAKISAFMERQDTVYRRYPLSDTSLPGRYAHAITRPICHGDLRSAHGPDRRL